jgi:hypothetical protein
MTKLPPLSRRQLEAQPAIFNQRGRARGSRGRGTPLTPPSRGGASVPGAARGGASSVPSAARGGRLPTWLTQTVIVSNPRNKHNQSFCITCNLIKSITYRVRTIN